VIDQQLDRSLLAIEALISPDGPYYCICRSTLPPISPSTSARVVASPGWM